jgi:hypothetical protein
MYPLPEDRSDVDVSVADAHNNLPIPFAFVEVLSMYQCIFI